VYLAIYTPLKRRTPFATVVGGIPGAIPPLIGWAVVRGSLSMEAWALFFILFFWQTPHFLSLAWMYRKDYARAGYKTLVVLDETGRITGRQIVISCCALVPASLLPTLIGLSGYLYFAGALFLSCSFLIIGLLFFREQSSRAARRIFFSSLLFITILFLLLILA
jgi:protoheme IX farnesyltransferase